MQIKQIKKSDFRILDEKNLYNIKKRKIDVSNENKKKLLRRSMYIY